jgi:alpha-amylase
MNSHLYYYVLGALFLIVFISMTNSIKAQPSSSSSAEIAYEIFVQSYVDSNGDGIGDLKGLISKLDYIQTLGATAIWLMPIHPSPSYHKYDVTDYYAIHPNYGTMADMDNLISEIHKRKMKIILDLVINHTSDQHPWFIASSSADSNEYRNYYVWRNFEEVKDEINKKTTTFDSDNITQWHTSKSQEKRYYGFFNERMPDLNFDYPPVREEVYKIGKFWLDKGIDGFRLDAAKHIYPDDRLDDTRKFWEEFTARMKKIKPGVKIIGEVWSDPQIVASLFTGLPSMFNFELTKLIPDCIKTHDPQQFITAYKAMEYIYKASGKPYEDATLLSNHDMNRIRSTLDGSVQEAKLAAAILLTLPGTPYLYYGEEIGMLGMKPDNYIREPFLWSSTSTKDTTWLKPKYSIPPDVTPLDEQLSDPKSMYTFYQNWISYRKTYPALSKGTIDFVTPEFPTVLTFIRSYKEEKIMVIHNLDEKAVEIKVMEPFTILVPGPNQLDEHRLLIPRYGSTLLKLGK